MCRPMCDRPMCDRPMCDRPMCGRPMCDRPMCDRLCVTDYAMHWQCSQQSAAGVASGRQMEGCAELSIQSCSAV